jgi:aldehyde:ferredoxin oxidoreductase
LLAHGSARAAEKIGKGAEYLVTVKGIELPMHDPKLGPGFARTYAVDPTPGRHVKGGLGLMHMMSPDPSKYNPEGSGEPDLHATVVQEVLNAAGLCLFKDFTGVQDISLKLIPPVTGWTFGAEEERRAGIRIFTMRHAFNLREGMKPADFQLPARCVGEPAQTQGPHEGVTIDHKAFIHNFFQIIEWDETTGKPSRSSLEKLGGMEDVIDELDL